MITRFTGTMFCNFETLLNKIFFGLDICTHEIFIIIFEIHKRWSKFDNVTPASKLDIKDFKEAFFSKQAQDVDYSINSSADWELGQGQLKKCINQEGGRRMSKNWLKVTQGEQDGVKKEASLTKNISISVYL